jgi:homoserine O-succinyltransferase
MPIVIPKDIPAYKVLTDENIFVMTHKRAITQDIRPIEIAILNLMPTKIETETQLMRLLSNSPLQMNLTLLNTATYESKHVSKAHLEKFYKSFNEVKHNNYDGMIITGAPVEILSFEDVRYWEELTQIFDFAKRHVTSTIFICWGAQAALYYYYGINKKALPNKISGVYEHRVLTPYDPLMKGMDDLFFMPHSRYTESDSEAIRKCKDIAVMAKSDKAGLAILKSKDSRQVYIFGHCEYDRDTLLYEYERDIGKGFKIDPPENYFTDFEKREVTVRWKSAANVMFTNWLNYYVYQVTPYNLEEISTAP